MRTHRPPKQIGIVIGLEAASLAAMSVLHLTGILAGGSTPSEPSAAGIAEAIICLVLAAAAVAVLNASPHAPGIATGAVLFAIVGFLAGLSFTVRGGDAIDIAYHATVLPLLLLTLAALRPRSAVSIRS